ncbi:MAG: alpha-ketoacid dehydrogenase subunit beta [Eubacteriales bacterium]
MRELTYVEALREALREELMRDERVFIMGEDVGKYGGIFRVTQGLWDEFGDERVMDTPISEAAIVGAAAGAAATGMRPVAELMFMDFITIAMDQLVNQAAKMRYMFGGKASVPMVVRTNIGAGRSSAAQHSQSLQAWVMHVPGLKVVMPADPYDAKGLLKAAIRDNNPVVFLEHKFLYPVKGPVPQEDYTVPLGQAAIKRAGTDVTVIATSLMVRKSLAVAATLAEQGIEVEVIDPRTLVPLDRGTLVESAKKTGRVVVVDEGCKTAGVGAELAATIMEEAFDYLDAPVMRVCAPDAPVPFSPALEKFMTPSEERIIETIKGMIWGGRTWL